MAEDMAESLRRVAAQMGVVLSPAAAPLSSPSAPVDPVEMKPQWELELDAMIAASGVALNITLKSGKVMRVVAEPKPAEEGVVEVSRETFKRLSRAADILNAKVVGIGSKDAVDAYTQSMVDRGAGFWASQHVFVEVDRNVAGSSRPSESAAATVVAAPNLPPSPPPVDPRRWVAIAAGAIVGQEPMRVGAGSGRVVGTLLRTTSGPLYARTAKDGEQRLGVRAEWALAGAFSIDREVYDKYLTDPATVIKVAREDRVYLTTSAWVQRYGGIVRQWGVERIVMPLAGNFWLVAGKDGEVAF